MHRMFLILAGLLCAVAPVAAEPAEKWFGFYNEITNSFHCDTQDVTADHSCSKIPPDEEMVVDIVEIGAFACKGPLDVAKIKRGDFLISVDGVQLRGLKTKDYDDLMNKAAQKGSSIWQIVRPSEVTKPEVLTITVVPQVIDDNADFDSCGTPDLEG
jgi:hypothetical protein